MRLWAGSLDVGWPGCSTLARTLLGGELWRRRDAALCLWRSLACGLELCGKWALWTVG